MHNESGRTNFRWRKALIAQAALLTLFTAGAKEIFMGEPAQAKAYHATKSEMIHNADIIAVVQIKSMEKTEKRGSHWTFSQVSKAEVLTPVKGVSDKELTLYGGEDFICAQCHFLPGKSLVFLNKDTGLYTGTNWHLSCLPIKDDRVEWVEGNNRQPTTNKELSAVIAEIKATIGPPQKLTAPLKVLQQAPSLDDGVIGEAPESSKSWQAYRKALPAAAQTKPQLLSMIDDATPAGRIYAAMLLYHADKAAGKAAFTRLSQYKSTVDFKSGCRMTSAGGWQIASEFFSNGKYLTLALE